MSGPVLAASAVGKAYGSRRVLSGVELEVGPGEVVGICGPSGTGKSTLLRLLAAIERPDSGTVQFGGQPAWAKRRRRVPRPGFVMPVFQHPRASLDPRWPIGRTVAEPMLRAPDRRGRARDLLDRVGLSGVDLDARPTELSGGQCQRVAIARALAADPALVLADEPTSALDVTTAAGVLHVLRAVATSGTAIVLVSHDEAVLGVLADRVLRLADGRLSDGSLAQRAVAERLVPSTGARLNSIRK